MTKYSHSRIGMFENCPLQYKYKYIDKIPSEFEESDNTFLGSHCHLALEKLYRDRMDGKTCSKEELLQFFDEQWAKDYNHDNLKHPEEDKSGEYYHSLGRDMIGRYYDNYFVGDEMQILGVETDDTLVLPDGNQYYIRIDKFGRIGDTYYVCDYKTDKKAKEQSVADQDRQLAMYALWVKRTFRDAKDVKLQWQMLRFDGDEARVESQRTSEQLDELEKDVVEKIAVIESTKVFKPSDDAYCDYCMYQNMCPKFAKPEIINIEDATLLADEYIVNDDRIKSLEKRNNDIKEELEKILHGNEKDVVLGSKNNLSAKLSRSVEYEDREKMESLLKEKGLYDGYLKFDVRSLNKDVLEGTADKDIIDMATVKDGRTFRIMKKKSEEE